MVIEKQQSCCPRPCGRALRHSPEFLTSLRDIATLAVNRAGKIQMEAFGQQARVVERKPHDLKLAIDRRSERVILETISERFPDHGFISEEYGIIEGCSEYYWIVDPLDGSVNYSYGMPFFAISIACYRKNRARVTIANVPGNCITGIVYLPYSNDLFEAVEGRPALKNNRPVSAGSEVRLSEAIISLSFGSDETTMRRMEKINARLLRQVRKIRIHGATAADLVNVACGQSTGLVQCSVKIWDFAAAALILKQAGGCFFASRSNGSNWEIIAGAPGIFDELTKILEGTCNPTDNAEKARPTVYGLNTVY